MAEANPPDSVGISLEKLLRQWRAQHRPSAEGGWWALAGFSFQCSIFLLRLFGSLQIGTSEPGGFAEMEQLSDILAPEGGLLRLIQVKRTLRKSELIAAVREAYQITQLCQDQAPELLGYLCFQIACRSRKTNSSVTDLSLSEVVKDGDPMRWQAMLDQFDKANPIVEEPDPLDHLHLYLWNLGIENPSGS